MNIEDYRYVMTVADTGSFTGAAKQLFIAQSSLSQRVKHIEDTYGADLFVRDSTKGIALTPAGERFLVYAKQILDAEENLRKELSDISKQERKKLRIGVCNLITSRFFENLIFRFNEEHPDIQCDFIHRPTAQLWEALRSNAIDVAICYSPVPGDDLLYDQMFTDRFVFVPAVGSQLSEYLNRTSVPGGTVDPQMLDKLPLALNRPGTMLYQYLTQVLAGTSYKPDVQHYSSNYSMLLSFAETGIASTILYESFFDSTRDHIPYYYLSGSGNDLSVVLVRKKTGICASPQNVWSPSFKRRSESSFKLRL